MGALVQGWLVYPLNEKATDGHRVGPLPGPVFVTEHPGDAHGAALFVPCEAWDPDASSGPVAHLPAEGQPQ